MSQRIKSIDGLKGIASIIIFFSHIRLAFSHTTFLLDKLLSHRMGLIVVNGAWALIVFYLLSGFSISMLVFSDETGKRIKRLCTTRIFRLGIPVVVIFLITFVLQKSGLLFVKDAGALLQNNWLIELVSFDGTFLQMCKKMLWEVWVIPGDLTWMSIFSSLPYFLLAPFIIIPFALMLKGEKKKNAFILTILLFVFVKKLRGYEYVALLCGSFMAWIYKYCDWTTELRELKGKWKWLINSILTIVFLTAPAYGDIYCGKFSRHGFAGSVFAIIEYYYLASVMCLVMLIIINAKLDKLLNAKPFQYLGKISYSVWMVHSTVIASYSSAVYVFLRNQGIEHKWCTPPVFVTSTILVILVAGIFYKLVEEKLYNKLIIKIKL